MLQAAVRVSRESTAAVARLVAALSPLHNELAAAPAAAKALREREDALLTRHALADDLEQKRSEIAGLEQEGSKVCHAARTACTARTARTHACLCTPLAIVSRAYLVRPITNLLSNMGQTYTSGGYDSRLDHCDTVPVMSSPLFCGIGFRR